MATRPGDTERAILSMLQRYGVMTMDEIQTIGQPDFTWSEVFLAIDRLSRKKLIALHRTGSAYQVTLGSQVWAIADVPRPEGSAIHTHS